MSKKKPISKRGPMKGKVETEDFVRKKGLSGERKAVFNKE